MEIPIGSNHKERAENCLHFLRIGFTPYNSFLIRLLKEITDGNLSLVDIGTSEEELKRLAPVIP